MVVVTILITEVANNSMRSMNYSMRLVAVTILITEVANNSMRSVNNFMRLMNYSMWLVSQLNFCWGAE